MEARLSDHASASQASARARRFDRYRFDVRLRVSVFREGVTTGLWGRSSELGMDGIGATLSGELKEGEVVSLEFPVPLPRLVMNLRAIVRYSDGLRCGLEFLVVTNEQKETMRRLCEVLASAS